MNDRPTIAERYGTASRTSDLTLDLVRPRDVDVLIAAGLVRETLATRLIRLRGEFDSVRNGGLTVSCGIHRTLVPALKSYPTVREHLSDWACAEAPLFGLAPAAAADAALKVLDLFLDPTCAACDGRGFTGGYGLPTVRCTTCRETGRRKAWFRTDAEDAFARWLEVQIEKKISLALAKMRELLRTGQFGV